MQNIHHYINGASVARLQNLFFIAMFLSGFGIIASAYEQPVDIPGLCAVGIEKCILGNDASASMRRALSQASLVEGNLVFENNGNRYKLSVNRLDKTDGVLATYASFGGIEVLNGPGQDRSKVFVSPLRGHAGVFIGYGQILLFALLIVLFMLLLGHKYRLESRDKKSTSLDIFKSNYAFGALSREEYESLKKALRG